MRAASGLARNRPSRVLRRGFAHEWPEDVVVAQSQPLERLANRKDIGAGRGGVFLEAENHAHLPAGIGGARRRDVRRRFYYVADNGFTGFIFEFDLLGGAKRRTQQPAMIRRAARQRNDRSMGFMMFQSFLPQLKCWLARTAHA
jgi:hypothetical protein